MALTWQAPTTSLLPRGFSESKSEGPAAPVEYSISQANGRILYQLKLPGGSPLTAPVEAIVGGKRHGISFLARVSEIGGLPLARPSLIETRYLHSTVANGLVLSPGFPGEKPTSYETAIGRVLAPDFQKKCLTCHGEPEPGSTNRGGGVHCETCHGPGQAHLQSVAEGKPRSGIINPAHLTNAELLERCSQCHSGFSELSDPLPDDLLISNQVNALKNSECYLQSGAGLSCITCHDPHQDSPEVADRSLAACRSCHGSAAQKRAGVCPVNQKDSCLKCHMPEVTKGSFTMADHWIRVHPEQGASVATASLATTVRPRRLNLRIIVTQDQERAKEAHSRLNKGESFFDLARDYSVDGSALAGGYLGEVWLDQMEPKLAQAASELRPGETSGVIENGRKFILLQRMARDFRWQADQIQQQASELRFQGKLAEAISKYREALQIYPHFLRALIFLGTTLGEQGQTESAAGVLEFAARLYPKDPAAQYNLGIAYGALGRAEDEMRAYRRAIDLQPDLVAAYQNLGAALLSSSQPERAAEVYRLGLAQNPLSAALYYNLSVVEEQLGETSKAKKTMELAGKIDPELVRKQQGPP